MKHFTTRTGIKTLVLLTLLSSSVLAQSNTGMTSNHAAAYEHTDSQKDAPFWSAQQATAAKQEAFLLQAIEKNPQNKAANAQLANLYLANNKTKKAIGAYQQAIIVDADNARLFAGISIAYLHQSKYAMAKAMAEQAIALDPEMKHAMKIKEYITKKEAIIAQADAAKPDMTQGSAHGAKPVDSTHK